MAFKKPLYKAAQDAPHVRTCVCVRALYSSPTFLLQMCTGCAEIPDAGAKMPPSWRHASPPQTRSAGIAVSVLRSARTELSGGAAAATAEERVLPEEHGLQKPADGKDEWSVVVLGDLHLDPGDMDLHNVARCQLKDLLDAEEAPAASRCIVSLGDLGAYGSAGTTENFKFTRDWLGGFGYRWDIITGNHDLEGMDEFDTDAANLGRWMEVFNKEAPQFCTVRRRGGGEGA